MAAAKDGEGTQSVGFAGADLLYVNDVDCTCSFRATRAPLPTAEDITHASTSVVPSDTAARAALNGME
eukprot:5294087-Lingulodinium_polyedra.AAC.1